MSWACPRLEAPLLTVSRSLAGLGKTVITTAKTLCNKSKDLEVNGVMHEITPFVRTLDAVLKDLHQWGGKQFK